MPGIPDKAFAQAEICLLYTSVGGKTKFVCVDGPEFDAHQVDFDEMIMRLGAYKDIEKK